MKHFLTPSNRILSGFIILFISLGLGYSTLTPIFENSDETLHFPYVKHLADGQGLPLAAPGKLWNQEGTQPPLYYAIAAATTFWIDTDNLSAHLQRNPHWLFTDVRSLLNDNQNLVLHGPMDEFPYRRTALAVHLSRGWSLLFGLITVICTFFIAQHFFPANLPLIISATALTAFTPQFLRVSATVSNDSLAAALASLTVLLALKFTRRSAVQGRTAPPAPQRGVKSSEIPSSGGVGAGQATNYRLKKPPQPPRGGSNSPIPPSGGLGGPHKISKHPTHPSLTDRAGVRATYPLILGLLSGLALLTKLSSLATGLLAATIILWQFVFRTRANRAYLVEAVRWWLVIGVAVVALTGWWFGRNYWLYGEWLATETHLNLAGRGHLSPAEIWNLRSEIERAYWATFGWGQIRPPEWMFQALGWFTRIGLGGLLVAALLKLSGINQLHRRTWDFSHLKFPVVLFLAFWAGLNLLLYTRWVMEVGSVSHTRLIFPAITAVSLLLALGWHALLPRRLEIWFSGLLAASLVVLNVYSLGWLIHPAFSPNQSPLANGTPVNLTFLDSLQITAADVHPADNPAAHTVEPGDTVYLKTRWQVLDSMEQNYSVAALLLGPDGQALTQRQTYPGLGLRPTRYLTPGDTFVDIYPLQIPTTVTRPLVARAVVNLFDFNSDTRAGFPALDHNNDEVTPVVGQIKITPRPWPEVRPAQTTNVNFADAINLIGYDLSPPLTLYWQSQKPVDEDYNLFIFLFDQEGELIAQADAPPTGNAYPTSWWSPGETIADVHRLPEISDVSQIRLGFYSLTSGQRLPVIESDLPHRDHGVEIVIDRR